jgi:hypothetical protein
MDSSTDSAIPSDFDSRSRSAGNVRIALETPMVFSRLVLEESTFSRAQRPKNPASDSSACGTGRFIHFNTLTFLCVFIIDLAR